MGVSTVKALATGSFGRFLTSGAFNTLATYLLYLALLPWFSYRVSYTAAYASGIGLAYVMNRYLVFRRPGGPAGLLLVALIYAGQYLLSLFLVTAWVRWLGLPAALAPLFAVAVCLPLTYLLNRKVFGGEAVAWPTAGAMARSAALLLPLLKWLTLAILVGLPILSLALNAIAWTQFGFDLPFFDDWRAYDSGEIDSLELWYLFRPLNDTLTPIGFGLDALAQRLLDGNSVVYQLLSMVTVLGCLLLLQWKLLTTALGDRTRAAVCFIFTLLMLQPGSYWGRENMAYQQALPLVFTLAALWLAVRRPLREAWNLPLILTLGGLSGMSYISGAFGALSAGAGLVLAVRLSRQHPDRAALLRAGLALALAGVATAAVQVFFAILPSNGGTHIAGKPLALPIEADFWFFYLGKLARSLLLPAHVPAWSLPLVLLACVLVVTMAILLLRVLRTSPDGPSRDLLVAGLFGAIAAMVVTYLALVAAGRANFRPPAIQNPVDVFAFAFERFHFFWATLLWPWMAAAGFVVYDWSGATALSRMWGRAVAWVVLAGAVVLMIEGGALGHYKRHSDEASFRRPTIDCLMTQLQKGEGISCEEFNRPDLTPAFIYARSIGASFVRYFPILPLELGTDAPSPWFRLSRDGARAQWSNVERRSGSSYLAGAGSELLIDVDREAEMASCVMLDIRVDLRVSRPGKAKLFYRPLGQEKFTEASSTSVEVNPASGVASFRLEDPLGFEKTLRLDPVASSQEFELPELEVRCRLKSKYSTLAPFYAITDGTSPGQLVRMAQAGDGPGHFRAGDDPRVLFRTRHRQSMATCRRLQVEAIYTVQKDDTGQLFYRPRGVDGFSEPNSLMVHVTPKAQPEPVSFVVVSRSGFEDELRFDPVTQAQDLRFTDITVKCLQRVERDWLVR